MERTQVYIDPVLKNELQKIAEESGKSMSEIIREAVGRYIADNRQAAIEKLKLSSALWKDRNDLTDSAEYINDLRENWDRHPEGGNE